MDGGLSLLLIGDGDGTFSPVPPNESGLIVSADAKGLAVSDLNGDSLPDFVIGANNDAWKTCAHATGAARVLKVVLHGTRGNPTAVGARATLVWDDGETQAAEVAAGGGYLSQSTSALFFGLGERARPSRIEVVWPTGRRTSSVSLSGSEMIVTISHPDS